MAGVGGWVRSGMGRILGRARSVTAATCLARGALVRVAGTPAYSGPPRVCEARL